MIKPKLNHIENSAIYKRWFIWKPKIDKIIIPKVAIKIKMSRAENRFIDVPLILFIVKTTSVNNVIPTKNIKRFDIFA